MNKWMKELDKWHRNRLQHLGAPTPTVNVDPGHLSLYNHTLVNTICNVQCILLNVTAFFTNAELYDESIKSSVSYSYLN